MKIAQIAPLCESVPPKCYGGTERIVSFLTESLVAAGHEVTLFASGDSLTAAELVPCASKALRLDPTVVDFLPHHLLLADAVCRRADEFDVLHFHIDLFHFPLLRDIAERTLTTLHGRLDLPDLAPFYRRFQKVPLVSISDAQRRPLPFANFLATVPHGLPLDLLPFRPRANGAYLAFLGRISPEKRPDRAIDIAEGTGIPLKIAAKIDKADRAYWEGEIRPRIAGHPLVEFVGEIGEAEKAAFLGEAAALLFPIDWPEPFGLVMIESMACGTPVVAFRCGSVPEVIDHGVTGFVVDTVEEAIAAVERAACLDRRAVRARFEARFSVERMTRDYLDLYRRLPSLTAAAIPQVAGNGAAYRALQ